MTLRLVSIIVILNFSCNTKSSKWETLDFGAFSLKAPQGWKKFKEQGIDAYIGGLTDGKDSLWFYYGMFISGPKDEESSNHLYGQDTINGYSSVIVIPKQEGKGRIELFIPNVTERDHFALSGYDIKDRETILKIFKSVTFKDSDTTKNSKLTLTKFKEYPFGSGRTLFYGYCASCHTFEKNLTGPALKSIINDRSVDWIYQFLTNRKAVLSDTMYQVRLKEFGNLDCMEFDNLSKQDVEQIVGYVRGK